MITFERTYIAGRGLPLDVVVLLAMRTARFVVPADWCWIGGTTSGVMDYRRACVVWKLWTNPRAFDLNDVHNLFFYSGLPHEWQQDAAQATVAGRYPDLAACDYDSFKAAGDFRVSAAEVAAASSGGGSGGPALEGADDGEGVSDSEDGSDFEDDVEDSRP